MRLKFSTVLYMAAAACAIAVLWIMTLNSGAETGAPTSDPELLAAISQLREGDMMKLVVHSGPKAAPETSFTLDTGEKATLKAYNGKIVLVNFWATWCAPCRKEMPMLSQLQSELGGDDFEVVTIATGRNPPPAMKAFFQEIGVENLPLHRDPKQQMARDMGILGLPVTVILDRNGFEIARLQGDADWSSDSAKAILTTLIGGD